MRSCARNRLMNHDESINVTCPRNSIVKSVQTHPEHVSFHFQIWLFYEMLTGKFTRENFKSGIFLCKNLMQNINSKVIQMNYLERKLKPLEMCYRALVWLCVCPCDVETSKWTKLLYKSFTTVNVTVIVCGFLAGVPFLIKFGSINIRETLYVIFTVLGNLLMQIAIVVGLVFQSTIINTFQLLSDICELC